MKKTLTILALCLASTGAFMQSASAQTMPAMSGNAAGGSPERMEQMAQQLQSRFANANTTRDGKLTKQQALAGMPMVARHFDEIDTANAGYVTLPQIEAFMQQRMTTR
jgi:hypothetical protein